jgi:ribosome-associated protein
VKVTAGDSRSQWRNRQAARKRLAELLGGALQDRRRRVPTRRSKSSQQFRIDDKRRQGAKKRLRGKPEEE